MAPTTPKAPPPVARLHEPSDNSPQHKKLKGEQDAPKYKTLVEQLFYEHGSDPSAVKAQM